MQMGPSESGSALNHGTEPGVFEHRGMRVQGRDGGQSRKRNHPTASKNYAVCCRKTHSTAKPQSEVQG